MFSQLSTGVMDIDSDDGTERRCLILSLPNELLCMVFAAVAFAEPPKGLGYFNFSNWDKIEKRYEILGFLRLSEVCTRFRRLLLSMPSVWASVVFDLPVEPSKLALLRSQSYPLSVVIDGVEESWMAENEDEEFDVIFKHHVAVAIEHAGRIRSLTTHECVTLYKAPSFSYPLPLLEDLFLEYSNGNEEESTDGFEYSYINAPNLRRAQFLFFSWESMFAMTNTNSGIKFVFPSLRSLDVLSDGNGPGSEDDDSEDVLLNLAWIVDLLKASPLIETIRFNLPTLIDDSDPWDILFADHNIQLKHLRAFDLRGKSALDMAGLYNHICLRRPQRCVLEFGPDIFSLDKAVNGAMQFARSFARLLQDPSHSGLLLALESDEISPRLQVGAFPAANSNRSTSSEDMSSMVALRLPSSYHDEDAASAYPQVFNTFAPALEHNKIQQLVLEIPHRHDWPYALDVLLKTCSKVTELVVRGFEPQNTTEFVLPALPDLLPSLETLIIDTVYWNKHDGTSYDCWEHLVSWLEYRAVNGLRIRCLYIQGPSCPVGAGDVAQGKDGGMCALAAQLVDEFFDERVGRV